MSGFSITITTKKPEIPAVDYHAISKYETGSIITDNALITRFTNPKFLMDKLFGEDEDIIIVTEGVILNLNKLRIKYKAEDRFECIKQIYIKEGNKLPSILRGEFSGMIYDKKKDIYFVFNNHTGSKPLFYYNKYDLIIIASEVKVVAQILKHYRKNINLDIYGAYQLLTYGNMLDDYTLINEIKRFYPGSYGIIKNNKLEISRYFVINNEPDSSLNTKKAIEGIEYYFTRAVEMEYEKDNEYKYKHIATLSGGMDSRSNVMIAHEMGYDDITNITTSFPNYWDYKIARKISHYLKDKFIFLSLGNGDYLKNIDQSFIPNDGLVYYPGSAHLLELLKYIDFDHYGLLHTGMIGDAVLGTFVRESIHKKPSLSKISWTYSPLMEKIKPMLIKSFANYPTQELYNLYNREFNGVFNGFWTTHHFTESASPYTDIDFLEFVMRIPPSIKKKTKIQIEWINRKHPLLTQFITERYLNKPKENRFWLNSNIFMLKIAMSRLLGQHFPLSMIPYEYWYKNNKELETYYNTYFEEGIGLLDKHKELKTDCINQYNNQGFLKKSQVLTLIKALRFYKLDD